MQSLNNVHLNSSTKLSLNARFTYMQTTRPKSPGRHQAPAPVGGGGVPIPAKRGRRRSRSRSRSIGGRINEKSSLQNRKLLEQFDQKHKMRAALRIKRKSLRPSLTVAARQRLTNQNRSRVLLQRRNLSNTRGVVGGGSGIGNVGNRRRPIRRRSASITSLGTMQADLMANRNTTMSRRGFRARSNSTSSLAGRLGTRRQNVANNIGSGGGRNQVQRGRLNRNGPLSSLNRSNSRQSFNRINGNQRRGRSLSRQRRDMPLRSGQAGGVGQQQQQQQQRGRSNSRGRTRSRSRGRAGVRSNSVVQNNGGGARRRNMSVNQRLGPNRTRAPVLQRIGIRNNTNNGRPRIIRGRVIKHRPVVATGNVQNQRQNGGVNQRLGRSRTRLAQTAPNGRNRSRSRSRLVNRGQRQQPLNVRGGGGGNVRNMQNIRVGANRGGGGRRNTNQRVTVRQNTANITRGRGRSRSRGRGGRNPPTGGANASGAVGSTKTKEELDKELDQYMVNTKSTSELDKLLG